jgi:DNA adenine methylase
MTKFYSPLRYPGGKRKLADFFSSVCEKNNINGHYVEPYAGGASVALHLLINGFVKKITINDLDRAIYAFWHSILNDTDKFCDKIRKTDITINNWKKFKKIHKNKNKDSLFDLGFATFFLNRTNHSGVIDGGVIGGLKQKGKYKIDCRFKKEDLIERIKLIAKHKNHIVLRNLDAMDLINEVEANDEDKSTIFYFDPPYFLKGPSLYMNHYEPEDHAKVSEKIQKIKNAKWIVSYDNVPQIRKLYAKSKSKKYFLTHTAYEIRIGKEIAFHSKGLIVPRIVL